MSIWVFLTIFLASTIQTGKCRRFQLLENSVESIAEVSSNYLYDFYNFSSPLLFSSTGSTIEIDENMATTAAIEMADTIAPNLFFGRYGDHPERRRKTDANGSGKLEYRNWPVKHSAEMHGDLILGGLMMVHEREDSVTCGPVMPQGGVQALETMLYTLDVINAMGMLPNITMGAHILDDCDKDTYGLEMAVDFIKGTVRCDWKGHQAYNPSVTIEMKAMNVEGRGFVESFIRVNQ